MGVLSMLVGILLLAAACADDPDNRLVRDYAGCLLDRDSAVHRIKVANRLGTVPLDSEGMERLLHQELERGEITLQEMRLDYIRYCD